LLFAIGSERYTPYQEVDRPQELLTISNQILGKNQLSLAKYLFIANLQDDPQLDINDVSGFLIHMMERLELDRDLHFQTNTTIDTLDYTGDGLNAGSKVVFAAVGKKRRTLKTEAWSPTDLPRPFNQSKMALPGMMVVSGNEFIDYTTENERIRTWSKALEPKDLSGVMLIVIVDDVEFAAENVNNFVWATFTKSNPSHDIYGVGEFIENKHWGCRGPLIIDARKKPHHAPELIKDPVVEKRIDRLGEKGASLFGII